MTQTGASQPSITALRKNYSITLSAMHADDDAALRQDPAKLSVALQLVLQVETVPYRMAKS